MATTGLAEYEKPAVDENQYVSGFRLSAPTVGDHHRCRRTIKQGRNLSFRILSSGAVQDSDALSS